MGVLVYRIVVILLLLISVVSATTFRKMTTTELRQHAALIIMGRVARFDYQVSNGRVWTHIDVSVEKYLKGSGARTIRMRIPGGQQSINGRTLVTRVDGVPEIRREERAIFFLESTPPAYAGLLGWEQGFYRVLDTNGVFYAVRADHSEPPRELGPFLKELVQDQK